MFIKPGDIQFPKNFIRAGEAFTTLEAPVPAPYFRRTFLLPEAAEGQLLITACGFYELYLNGKRLTKGALAPYISNPDDMVYFDRYTLSLEAGENVLALLLGNGFQNNPGGYTWWFDKGDFRGAPQLALSLKVGDRVILESDESFKVAPSPIIFDDYRFGEHYDANRELPGWNTLDFDDSSWANAIPAPTPRGEARLCEAEPITVTGELAPVEILEGKNGSFIYDFGLNCAGVCRLKVRGKKGQRIEFQHGERLMDGEMDVLRIWFRKDPDDYERDRKLVHKDIYICNGQGEEVYTPSFTYHGFRYVTVTGITKQQATKDLLTYVVMNSDINICGGFETSHPVVSKLQELTLRSDLANFYYFPTDCPQREKNGWTADAALSAEQMLLNLTVHNSYREWMRNICKAQNDAGALPGIIPTTGWGFHWGNGPAWDSVLVYLPYYAYVYRQDRQVVEECAPNFMRYLHYLTTRKDSRGLMEIGLGDWCHVRTRRPKAPLVVTDTIMCVDIVQKMAFLLKELGMDLQSAFAEGIRADFRAAFRQHLIDFDTMTVAGACQTSQAMALHYGLFEPGEEPRAFARLLEMIRQQEDFMDVGVLGGKVLFHVLTRFRHTDLALKVMTRPEFPSYGNWVAQGATSLWEDFMEDPASMNHHFWGDISAWFIKILAGICYNPRGNNWQEVEIRPHFPEEMKDAKGWFDSNLGRIESRWQREGEKIRLTLTVPEAMYGKLILPEGWRLENGETLSGARSGVYLLSKT